MDAAQNRRRIGRDLAEHKPMPAPMPDYVIQTSRGTKKTAGGVAVPLVGGHGVHVA